MTENLKQSVIILTRIYNQIENARKAALYLVDKKLKAYVATWNPEEIGHLNTSIYGVVHVS